MAVRWLQRTGNKLDYEDIYQQDGNIQGEFKSDFNR